ncbi:MAG: VanZ family protein, partial [Acidobacteria bacterium]|nr:VanZ family protein [Acidobacteriota bacterium]
MSWFRPWTISAALWTLTVAWLMVLPSTSVDAAVSGWPILLEIPSLDKLIHVGSFGLVAWLWMRALAEHGIQASDRAIWLLPLLGTIAFGVVMEGVQSFLPTRSAQWADMLANSLGALVAV